MNETLERSEAIINRAIEDYQPYAIIAMVSGGTDSLSAYYAARSLAIPISGILHVHTGTGISDTTSWVRHWAESQPFPYFEASAEDTYEDYVIRKGFIGIGRQAHNFSWHLLKATPYRKELSRSFRQGRRGRRILLINGARSQESDNRMLKIKDDVQQESKTPNYWVNLIRDWSAGDCLQFLGERGVQHNPVSQLLHRSGECMCGTMQSKEERQEASYWFPQWGKWLDGIEKRVTCNFNWKWGEKSPADFIREKNGQLPLPTFTPMCSSCVLHGNHAEAQP